MEIKLNNQGQYVDVVTGQVIEEIEMEDTKQHSIEVDDTTVNYIVKQVFNNTMDEYTKIIVGNKIILDRHITYTIEIEPYNNIYNLYVHNQSDYPMFRRQGHLK